MNEREVIAFLASDRTQSFIWENEHTPVDRVLLNPDNWFKGYEKLIADQLISRKKARKKLPSWYKNPGIVYPPPLSLEQCSSEVTALHKSTLLSEEIIDLTGGSGVDTLYFQGPATFVEKDPWLCEVFRHNAALLGKEIKIINQQAEDFIRSFDGMASFYIDPHRRNEARGRVFRFQDCSPDVTTLLQELLKKGDRVLIKTSPMIDLKQGIKELTCVKEVFVVAVKNEVKEVLFLIDKNHSAQPLIKCTDQGYNYYFEFTFSEEQNANEIFSEPEDYLLDPNAAILKAGAFKLLNEKYDISKINVNTHLFTSRHIRDDFPGRHFRIIERNVGKKEIKKYAPDGKINLISKNYPLKAEELKKKFKLKDGGKYYLIAFRDHKNTPRMVVAMQPLISNH